VSSASKVEPEASAAGAVTACYQFIETNVCEMCFILSPNELKIAKFLTASLQLQ